MNHTELAGGTLLLLAEEGPCLETLLESAMQELADCHCEVLLVLYLLFVELSEREDAHGEDVHAAVALGEALDALEDLCAREGTRR